MKNNPKVDIQAHIDHIYQMCDESIEKDRQKKLKKIKINNAN